MADQPAVFTRPTAEKVLRATRSVLGIPEDRTRGETRGPVYSPQSRFALIRNQSGADVPRFGVLVISGTNEFRPRMGENTEYRGIAPTIQRWNRIAVAQEAIADDAVGLCAIGGVCTARVQRLAPFDTNEKIFANISPGESRFCVAHNIGPMRLLESTPFEIDDSPPANTGLYEVMLTHPIDPQCSVKLISSIARGKYAGRTFSYAANVAATGALTQSEVGDIAIVDDAIVINPAEIATTGFGILVASGQQPILRATQRGLLSDGKVVLEVAGYPLRSCS